MTGFCERKAKKRMIFNGYNFTGALRSIMRKAFLIAAIGLSMMAAPVYAHDGDDHDDGGTGNWENNNPNIKQFQYQYAMDENYYPGYRIAVKEMKETLKGTASDLSLPRPMNPPLNIAEYDLNGDKMAEMIVAPIETTEDGNYCKGILEKCPHYILDTSKNKVRVLGVIEAFAIDRGDEIKNGYWTLKVFKDRMLPEFYPQIDIYAYDKKQNKYMKQQPN